VARPRRCLTLSNPVPWQNWMVAYLGYTLRMRTLFRGWPIMVMTRIREEEEYASPSGILALQVNSLTYRKRRTCQIIIGGGKYRDSYTALNLDSQHVRSQQQCKTLFDKIVHNSDNTEHCLHYLLPTERDPSVTSRLCSADKLPRILVKTNTFNNPFLCFGLLNFQ